MNHLSDACEAGLESRVPDVDLVEKELGMTEARRSNVESQDPLYVVIGNETFEEQAGEVS